MSDYGLKFHHAGTPEPDTSLPTMQVSDAVPHGWAGCSGMSYPDSVEQVGAVYADLVSGAVDAALAKRDAEHYFIEK